MQNYIKKTKLRKESLIFIYIHMKIISFLEKSTFFQGVQFDLQISVITPRFFALVFTTTETTETTGTTGRTGATADVTR